MLLKRLRTACAALLAFVLAAGPALGADKPVGVYNATTGRIERVGASDTATTPALKVTGIASGTQCLQANASGTVSGTGSACGSGSGTIGGSTGSTDERLIRADGAGGATVQAGADLTLSDGGVLGFPDGVRQTFNPDGTNAGVNVGAQAGDPSAPSNGDIWYNSSANALKARANGATTILAPLDAELSALAGLTSAADKCPYFTGSGAADVVTCSSGGRTLMTNGYVTEAFCVAASDETTAITTGTAKITFRMPYAFTLTAIRASVNTAPTGSTIIIDANEAGSTILSTKLSIDASELTSTTAASAAVISDAAFADDAEVTLDFDQVGSTIAGKGVKVCFIGHQ